MSHTYWQSERPPEASGVRILGRFLVVVRVVVVHLRRLTHGQRDGLGHGRGLPGRDERVDERQEEVLHLPPQPALRRLSRLGFTASGGRSRSGGRGGFIGLTRRGGVALGLCGRSSLWDSSRRGLLRDRGSSCSAAVESREEAHLVQIYEEGAEGEDRQTQRVTALREDVDDDDQLHQQRPVLATQYTWAGGRAGCCGGRDLRGSSRGHELWPDKGCWRRYAIARHESRVRLRVGRQLLRSVLTWG